MILCDILVVGFDDYIVAYLDTLIFVICKKLTLCCLYNLCIDIFIKYIFTQIYSFNITHFFIFNYFYIYLTILNFIYADIFIKYYIFFVALFLLALDNVLI